MNNFFKYLVVAAAFSVVALATASAQKLDATPQMHVGDKWTYRYINSGDRREPYIFTHEVKRIDGNDAWLYGESTEPGTQNPKYWWRYDHKRAGLMERFAYDESAPNSLGTRIANRQKNDDFLQYPLEVGKKYNAKEYWSNGYTDWKIEVEAFEKIKTEAGEFDTFRVKATGWWTRTSNGSGSGRAEATGWVTPTAKREVRWQYMDRTPNGSMWNENKSELIKWEPAAVRPAAPASAAR